MGCGISQLITLISALKGSRLKVHCHATSYTPVTKAVKRHYNLETCKPRDSTLSNNTRCSPMYLLQIQHNFYVVPFSVQDLIRLFDPKDTCSNT